MGIIVKKFSIKKWLLICLGQTHSGFYQSLCLPSLQTVTESPIFLFGAFCWICSQPKAPKYMCVYILQTTPLKSRFLYLSS